MKLKKIASLALAGIMAVSMLAGCKDNPSSSSEPTNPVTPVTGAAAIINEALDENSEKVAFTDNEIIAGLMADYYAENPITEDVWNAGVNGLTKLADTKLSDAIKAVIGDTKTGHDLGYVSGVTSTDKESFVSVYVFNNDFVSQDNALRMVGKYIDSLNLPDDNKDGATAATHDYKYVGSVAAVEAESAGGTESVWVIAVSITRTASKK